jgi:hypothetical protein
MLSWALGGVRLAATRTAVSSPALLVLRWGGRVREAFCGLFGAYQRPLPAFASSDPLSMHEPSVYMVVGGAGSRGGRVRKAGR